MTGRRQKERGKWGRGRWAMDGMGLGYNGNIVA